jgi:hypothetical protein
MKPSPKKLKETKNIYYKVVDHLISEGYATDSDSADNIIKGMSDEWFETIIDENIVQTIVKGAQEIGKIPGKVIDKVKKDMNTPVIPQDPNTMGNRYPRSISGFHD